MQISVSVENKQLIDISAWSHALKPKEKGNNITY